MNSSHQSIEVPLKVKNGVSASCLYLKKGSWDTVFDYFCHSFPHISIKRCKKRFEEGEVRYQDGEVVTLTSSYQEGLKIYYYRELPSEMVVPFKETILFENERFLIVDKPHFLPVAPSGEYLQETLIVRLRKNLQIDGLELAHRLDRETAGLVLVTKKKQFRAEYHRLFSDRKIEKIYHAVAPSPRIDLRLPLIKRSQMIKSSPFYLMMESGFDSDKHDYNSETKIELINIKGNNALYQLTPKTGKKHQLRVHMSSLGIPIKNDHFYPRLTEHDKSDFSRPLQLLAKTLRFQDPFDNNSYQFDSHFVLQI